MELLEYNLIREYTLAFHKYSSYLPIDHRYRPEPCLYIMLRAEEPMHCVPFPDAIGQGKLFVTKKKNLVCDESFKTSCSFMKELDIGEETMAEIFRNFFICGALRPFKVYIS